METDSGCYGPKMPDALLIAAAPAMLQALEAMLPALRDNVFFGNIVRLTGGQFEGAKKQDELIEQIEAAIRAAKGE